MWPRRRVIGPHTVRLLPVSSILDIDVLAYESSPIGMICLRTRPHPDEPETLITEITLDHEFLMSSLNTASERALSSSGLALHPGKDLRILVGGLGLGYTAWEAALSDRVAHIEVIEYLPQVMDWMAKGLVPLSESVNGESRIQVTQGDVYAQLAAAPSEHWDLILIDVDHSPDEWLGEQNDGFYSEAGLRAARQHLAPGGILGVWSYAPHSPFADAMRAVFDDVTVEDVSFDNPFFEDLETNWLFFGRN